MCFCVGEYVGSRPCIRCWCWYADDRSNNVIGVFVIFLLLLFYFVASKIVIIEHPKKYQKI